MIVLAVRGWVTVAVILVILQQAIISEGYSNNGNEAVKNAIAYF